MNCLLSKCTDLSDFALACPLLGVSSVITCKMHSSIERVARWGHLDEACRGDPPTFPRLFDIIADCTNGQVATDAAEPADGGMEMLQ